MTGEHTGTLKRLTADPGRTALLVAGGLGFVLLGASQALYGPFYGALQENFALSAAQVSIITTVHFVGATAAMSTSGFLTRRFGALRVVQAATFALALGFLAIAVAPTWALVLTGATILGIGFGGLVTMNFLVARVFGSESPAALNALNAMFGVGAVVAPVAAAPFAAQGARGPVFALGGALAALLGLYFVFTKRIHVEEAPVRLPGSIQIRSYILPVFGFIALYFFYMASEASFGNWIPTHLTPAYGSAPASRFVGLFWLALTAGRLVATPVSLRVAPERVVGWSLVFALAAAVAASAVPIAPIAYVVAGFFCGPVFPGGLAWIRRRFPALADEVSSVVLAVGGIGTVIAPPVIGTAVDIYGVSSIPAAIALLLVCAGATAQALKLNARRRAAGLLAE
ncbi:MAG: MFS transporter [Spirochaetota bacterium]